MRSSAIALVALIAIASVGTQTSAQTCAARASIIAQAQQGVTTLNSLITKIDGTKANITALDNNILSGFLDTSLLIQPAANASLARLLIGPTNPDSVSLYDTIAILLNAVASNYASIKVADNAVATSNAIVLTASAQILLTQLCLLQESVAGTTDCAALNSALATLTPIISGFQAQLVNPVDDYVTAFVDKTQNTVDALNVDMNNIVINLGNAGNAGDIVSISSTVTVATTAATAYVAAANTAEPASGLALTVPFTTTVPLINTDLINISAALAASPGYAAVVSQC